MFRETRQANVITSQLLHMQPTIRQTCCRKERERHWRSKIRLFTDWYNSHYISQLPWYFIDSRTKRFTTESHLSLPDIQTQLNFEIANRQQNSFTAETDLNQRKLASTLK